MKKIMVFLIAMLFVPQLLFGAGLTFNWQQELVPDMAGWKLFKSDVSGSGYVEFIDVKFIDEQLVYTADKDVVVPGNALTKIYFILSSYDTNGNPSDATPEIVAEIDTRDLVGPPMPLNFKVKVNIE